MRILQIANYSENVGGIAVQVKQIHDHLVADGLECDIFSTKGSVFKRLASVFELLRQGRGYDVFHIHACSDRGFFPAIMGVTVGRLLRKRIILTYHGGGAERFFKKRAKLVRYYLTRTDANIVLSGFVGSVFDRYRIAYTVIPNIVDLRAGVFRERPTIGPRLIGIRSLYDIYNIECTLRAYEAVLKKFPGSTLTLLGDGPLREKLERYVRERNLRNVSFVGHVSNTEIYRYLNRSDIMVSSSRFDNMPVSVLEGFNAGLLVIASNVGGVPYMIEDGINGLLFESDDDDGLAAKIIWALEHPEESHRMIDMAHQSVALYSWTRCRPLLMDLYSGE